MASQPTSLTVLAWQGFMLAVVLVTPVLPTNAATSDRASLDLMREQRVALIGYRLASAGISDCDRIEPMTGLGLHDVSSYSEQYRATIRKTFNMTNGFGIRFVVPGSAGQRAGLVANDEITALNGRPLDRFAADQINRDASPARTEQFAANLSDALTLGTVMLTVRRDDVAISAPLTADAGCGGRFVVAADDSLNAWSDGGGVAVTARLVDFARSDDELAFIIAHELSHNILHHADRTRGHSPLLASVGIGAGVIKSAEIEADKLGVSLLRRAGYDPHGGESLLVRLSHARGPALAVTHPGTKRRIRIIRDEARRALPVQDHPMLRWDLKMP